MVFLTQAVSLPAGELPTAAELGFKITHEAVIFSRWLQLSNRTIRFPASDGRPVQCCALPQWDVLIY